MQAELHRHLEASFRPKTLLEIAQESGLEGQSTSLSAFREKLVIQAPLSNLNEFLERFSFVQKIIQRPKDIQRITTEAVVDCWHEGTRFLELRYSPSFISEKNNLPWQEVLMAIEAGIEAGRKIYPGIQVGLICTATRDYGETSVLRTIEFFLNHPDRFIGIDLAGNENEFPCRLFESSFKKVIQAGGKITIHAGEAAGPENIWEAIELLGAQRIGHGVRCLEDDQLVKYLVNRQICLEVCPTSNWLTFTVPNLAQHPLPKLLDHGIPVTISTDDPSFCGITLQEELDRCEKILGLSTQDLKKCNQTALKASFLPPLLTLFDKKNT